MWRTGRHFEIDHNIPIMILLLCWWRSAKYSICVLGDLTKLLLLQNHIYSINNQPHISANHRPHKMSTNVLEFESIPMNLALLSSSVVPQQRERLAALKAFKSHQCLSPHGLGQSCGPSEAAWSLDGHCVMGKVVSGTTTAATLTFNVFHRLLFLALVNCFLL